MKLKNIVVGAVPWLIIAGLLCAGLFMKPAVTGKKFVSPAIEQRDSFFDLASPVPQVLWAVGLGGKVVRSNNAGRIWTAQTSPVSANLQSIAVWDEARAIAVGNDSVVIVTDDSGEHWKEVSIPLSSVSNKLMRVITLPNGEAWAVGEMGALHHTANYGETWKRMLDEQDTAFNDIAFRGNQGWIVGEFGKILRSEDGGKTWTPVSSPISSSLMSVAFKDDSNGVAVGLEGAVLDTHDGGKTWKEISRITREHLFGITVDKNAWWAVGDKGVLISSDSTGSQWKIAKHNTMNVGWITKVLISGERMYFAGKNLTMMIDGKWSGIGV